DEKPVRVVHEQIELKEKGRAVAARIREDRVEFFHAPAFDTKNLRRFCNGIVSPLQRLPNGSGNPDEALELVGEMLMTVDEHRNGRHHGFGSALRGEHDERLWPARALAGWRGLLSAWRSG